MSTHLPDELAKILTSSQAGLASPIHYQRSKLYYAVVLD